jgi:Zn-dependent peptidase ImmA (M78 family)
MVKFSPEVMRWARETAGLSADEAARRLGFRDGKKRTATDRLVAIESGAEVATRPVVLKMSKNYRRPLITFYLSTPPTKGDRGEDFRTLPDATDPNEIGLVDALVRDVRARQQMIRSILEDEDVGPLSFVGSLRGAGDTSQVASAIRLFLRYSHQDFYAARSPEAAFTALRQKTESKGLFVLLIGNLGSHHTALRPEVFRGFALADPVAPLVVINDQDAKAAWSFTLLHELAHVFLGQTGISNARTDIPVERLCNDVASQLLLPSEELNRIDLPGNAQFSEVDQAIQEFAGPRNLSYSMVAYRLFVAQRITRETWGRLSVHYREMWKRQRATAREMARQNDESGPSYYVVKRHKLGDAVLGLVRRSMDAGELTPVKAAKILGVKARSVIPLVSDLLSRRVA